MLKSFERSLLVVSLLAGLAVAPVGGALAQEHGHHDFHGRDVRHFGHDDLIFWRGGAWRHEWHNGRFGWWWFVGGVWYFYERPVYPYPLIVSDMAFAEPVVVSPPPPPMVMTPGVVQAQPPAAVAPQPQAQMWYYCDNPAGYYPYVTSCPTPFRAVPATPQPQAPVPGAPPAPGSVR